VVRGSHEQDGLVQWGRSSWNAKNNWQKKKRKKFWKNVEFFKGKKHKEKQERFTKRANRLFGNNVSNFDPMFGISCEECCPFNKLSCKTKGEFGIMNKFKTPKISDVDESLVQEKVTIRKKSNSVDSIRFGIGKNDVSCSRKCEINAQSLVMDPLMVGSEKVGLMSNSMFFDNPKSYDNSMNGKLRTQASNQKVDFTDKSKRIPIKFANLGKSVNMLMNIIMSSRENEIVIQNRVKIG
jgi:hypothetical protein